MTSSQARHMVTKVKGMPRSSWLRVTLEPHPMRNTGKPKRTDKMPKQRQYARRHCTGTNIPLLATRSTSMCAPHNCTRHSPRTSKLNKLRRLLSKSIKSAPVPSTRYLTKLKRTCRTLGSSMLVQLCTETTKTPSGRCNVLVLALLNFGLQPGESLIPVKRMSTTCRGAFRRRNTKMAQETKTAAVALSFQRSPAWKIGHEVQ
mmetsp:Transcript_122073/g.317133  ORF Transcript_122073/g.317133 Transcript_122073/m.317133 type:complete len:203 (+) Transcript_122073:443-1051(+)